jgi:cysteine desulfurase/selenocysteine lyase
MTDFERLRDDFPILQREINGAPLVYLDSAATTQKPAQVIDAVSDFYRTRYANVHRGVYQLAEEATVAYEDARAKVARFVNAGSPSEIVFTRGATTSLNMVAHGWGLDRFHAGDRIVLTLMEHHSNVVPWQLVARHTGAELVYLPFDEESGVDLSAIEETIDERVAVVAFSAMSNVTGGFGPLDALVKAARAVDALVVVDGAQAVPHLPVDVQQLGADFLAFSAHKMLGPTGVGALWGRPELLEEMEPAEGGGEMISDVQLYESRWAPVPHKFEAGTPPIAQAVGFGAAIDYLDKISMSEVRRHEQELTRYTLDRLAEIPDLRVFGPRDVERRGGVISFALGDIHAHDIATILNENGVAVRAGHHCAKPLMRTLEVAATARASLYVYNTRRDIDALVAGLERARTLFGLA